MTKTDAKKDEPAENPQVSLWDAVRYILAAAVIGFGVWYYCFSAPGILVYRETTGKTMGTDYIVKVARYPENADWTEETAAVQRWLDRIDGLMSTYRQNSEVCRFNAFTNTEDWFPVSSETAAVVQASQEIAALTGGAFDITAAPLVQLWGFGAGKTQAEKEPKTLEELKRASLELKEKIGYQHLSVRLDPPALKKSVPELTIDLSAVAKGFAVDCLAERFDKANVVKNYLIEIGGEVRCRGKKTKDTDWLAGIINPIDENHVQQKLVLGSRSLATSGNYRQLRQIEGETVTHIVDPRTCLPVRFGGESAEQLVSVSVILPECMRADAWATAMFVLGEKEGLELAGKHGIPVLFLLRQNDSVRESPSESWKKK
ncbi:MAG: FAD:protein FMN transferase [Planctomycetaceae bacterium]|jgi:thiamine biosynthesis lipoprotein|nr:FAD:protein FMN transferase [Planctomycetaceae bacterium]